MMKTILITLALGLPMLAQQLTITVDDAILRPGQQTTVRYSVGNGQGAVALDLTLSGVSNPQAVAPAALLCQGERCIAFSVTEPLVAEIATATFSASGDGQVALTATAEGADVAGQTIAFAVNPAVVVILSVEDIDGDGDIDLQDVLSAISQVFGVCSSADINGDGVCNLRDVGLIVGRVIQRIALAPFRILPG